MQKPSHYQQMLEDKIPHIPIPAHPAELYEPVRYMMSLGGKRIRPTLVLMACDMYGGDMAKAVMPALAMEMFHNFSLIHDDLMDHADVRRGKPTVHKRWNDSTAILSGDVMLVLAYDMLAELPPELFHKSVLLFNDTARKVCEGQQLDMLFENRAEVNIADYLNMTGLKTAALLAGCLKLGALLAKAPAADAERIYEFGYAIGTAFQIQDDILDAYGKPEEFGKAIGGDIAANKKTCLTLYAMQHAGANEKSQMEALYSKDEPIPAKEKISKVMELYALTGAREATEKAREMYYEKAMEALESLSGSAEGKAALKKLSQNLINRER